MKYVLKSNDLGDKGFPMLKDLIKDIDVKTKTEVLTYMKTSKFYVASAPSITKDLLGGGNIPNSSDVYSDGEYSWTTDDIYYFEKYNVSLDDEFIKKVIM